MRTLSQHLNESLNEAKGDWQFVKDKNPSIHRFSGKTYPCIYYIRETKKLVGRDNNGRHVSPELYSSDISVNGIKEILYKGISKPWPSEEMMNELIKAI